MVHARLWLVALILVAIVVVVRAWCCQHAWRRTLPRLPNRLRRLHPSTPDDCPHCRTAVTAHQGLPPPAVRPWREGRSRCGAPRRVSTDGYACRRPGCTYFGITDAAIHALVANGRHGRTDRIQQFRCQACGAKVSARWGTALSHLKTPPSRIGEVLSALAEGLDVHASHNSANWRQLGVRGVLQD